MDHVSVSPNMPLVLCGLMKEVADRDTRPGICGACENWRRKLSGQQPSARFPEPQTKKESPTMSIDMKAVLVKSVKQGASAGAIKAASRKIRRVLGEKYPMFLMLPPEMGDLALCLLISMVAQASPELPGTKKAEELAALAFEGILTATTSRIIEDMIEQVGPLLAELGGEDPLKALGENKKGGGA